MKFINVDKMEIERKKYKMIAMHLVATFYPDDRWGIYVFNLLTCCYWDGDAFKASKYKGCIYVSPSRWTRNN